MTVTFFGHRDAPDSIGQKLREVLIHLIEHEGAQCFYVGNEGAYDRLAQALLAGLQKQYSFEYTVVLAYMPTKEGMWNAPTLLPEAAACGAGGERLDIARAAVYNVDIRRYQQVGGSL